ncbi:MAG: hypothetical protein ACK5M4_16110 [Pseudorhodobacter sp.]
MKRPTFVARRSYRRRRLRDAARLLPVLGAFLMWLPMLWGQEGTDQRVTGGDLIYIFAVWAALVLCAAILSRRLIGEADDPAGRENED